MATVRVAVSLDDGTAAIVEFVVDGRSPTLPFGARWVADGAWHREPTNQNIFAELTKIFPETPQPTQFAIINVADLPAEREYRDAWEFDGQRVIVNETKRLQIVANRGR